ncbi:unnamed protein product [Phytophthora fragariaefolia]|uniref:Unnamed protein product n=1 Tax=Phytophthora fragariaefolia TaxID=1490495 RepID=A0A9W6Y7R5_9STRA|nr:unnamed protein product [Phytophthora fragariaefolia]
MSVVVGRALLVGSMKMASPPTGSICKKSPTSTIITPPNGRPITCLYRRSSLSNFNQSTLVIIEASSMTRCAKHNTQQDVSPLKKLNKAMGEHPKPVIVTIESKSYKVTQYASKTHTEICPTDLRDFIGTHDVTDPQVPNSIRIKAKLLWISPDNIKGLHFLRRYCNRVSSTMRAQAVVGDESGTEPRHERWVEYEWRPERSGLDDGAYTNLYPDDRRAAGRPVSRSRDADWLIGRSVAHADVEVAALEEGSTSVCNLTKSVGEVRVTDEGVENLPSAAVRQLTERRTGWSIEYHRGFTKWTDGHGAVDVPRHTIFGRLGEADGGSRTCGRGIGGEIELSARRTKTTMQHPGVVTRSRSRSTTRQVAVDMESTMNATPTRRTRAKSSTPRAAAVAPSEEPANEGDQVQDESTTANVQAVQVPATTATTMANNPDGAARTEVMTYG